MRRVRDRRPPSCEPTSGLRENGGCLYRDYLFFAVVRNAATVSLVRCGSRLFRCTRDRGPRRYKTYPSSGPRCDRCRHGSSVRPELGAACAGEAIAVGDRLGKNKYGHGCGKYDNGTSALRVWLGYVYGKERAIFPAKRSLPACGTTTVEHNVYLTYGSELGLVGLLLWISGFVKALAFTGSVRSSLASLSDDAAAWRMATVAYTAFYLVVASFIPPPTGLPPLILWVLLGVSTALRADPSRGRSGNRDAVPMENATAAAPSDFDIFRNAVEDGGMRGSY